MHCHACCAGRIVVAYNEHKKSLFRKVTGSRFGDPSLRQPGCLRLA
jgi:hypothetical protein